MKTSTLPSQEITTIDDLLKHWDAGDTIWSIELGGLGPGYEQAIQIAAVEFSRGCKDLKDIKKDDEESTDRFTKKCEEVLSAIDQKIGGLSGAMFGAAKWLAFQWCFNGGPAALIERLKKKGEDDRCIQVQKDFPTLAGMTPEQAFQAGVDAAKKAQ
jgi:hypothetical protein